MPAVQLQPSLESPSILSLLNGQRLDHVRGSIRARVRIRSTCGLSPVRGRALASYERAAVGRFGAPRHLTHLGTGLTMISAYEHGRNAAKHAKHIQACPFDTGTTEKRERRAGFHGLSQTSLNIFYKLAMAPKRPATPSSGHKP